VTVLRQDLAAGIGILSAFVMAKLAASNGEVRRAIGQRQETNVIGRLLLVDRLHTPLTIEVDFVPDLNGVDHTDRRARPIAIGEHGNKVGVVLVDVWRTVVRQILARPIRLEVDAGNRLDAGGGAGLLPLPGLADGRLHG